MAAGFTLLVQSNFNVQSLFSRFSRHAVSFSLIFSKFPWKICSLSFGRAWAGGTVLGKYAASHFTSLGRYSVSSNLAPDHLEV